MHWPFLELNVVYIQAQKDAFESFDLLTISIFISQFSEPEITLE